MGRALPLRGDFDASTLRRLAKGSRDAKQIRRLLSLAVIYEGGNRTAAARTGDDVMDLSLCGVAFLWESSPASEPHEKVRGGKDPCRKS